MDWVIRLFLLFSWLVLLLPYHTTIITITTKTFALGFFYGGKLVADDMSNGCFLKADNSDCMTGGKVLSTFFCIVMGSFALG